MCSARVRLVFVSLSRPATTSYEIPANRKSRRADSNRGPLHYESRPRTAASPRQSIQALLPSQTPGLWRTARSQITRDGVRLVFGGLLEVRLARFSLNSYRSELRRRPR
jgi:hypothetical protein